MIPDVMMADSNSLVFWDEVELGEREEGERREERPCSFCLNCSTNLTTFHWMRLGGAAFSLLSSLVLSSHASCLSFFTFCFSLSLFAFPPSFYKYVQIVIIHRTCC